MFLFSAGPPGFDYGLVGERGMIISVTKTNKGFLIRWITRLLWTNLDGLNGLFLIPCLSWDARLSFFHPCLVWKLLAPVARVLSDNACAAMISASVPSFGPVLVMVWLKGFDLTWIHTDTKTLTQKTHVVLTKRNMQSDWLISSSWFILVACSNVDWSDWQRSD